MILLSEDTGLTEQLMMARCGKLRKSTVEGHLLATPRCFQRTVGGDAELTLSSRCNSCDATLGMVTTDAVSSPISEPA